MPSAARWLDLLDEVALLVVAVVCCTSAISAFEQLTGGAIFSIAARFTAKEVANCVGHAKLNAFIKIGRSGEIANGVVQIRDWPVQAVDYFAQAIVDIPLVVHVSHAPMAKRDLMRDRAPELIALPTTANAAG